MMIKEQILVDAPVDKVWSLIDRLESVIPCVPGATYEGQEGEDHLVGIRVRIGVISASFKGRMRFAEKDATAHRAVIEGSGRDTGGKGSAKANIVGTLEAVSPTATRMQALVDLSMTGRIAQFGGPIVADIARQIVMQFGQNLQKHVLNAGAPTNGHGAKSDAPQEDVGSAIQTAAAPAAGEIDLGKIAWTRIRPWLLAAMVVAIGAAAALYYR